MNKPWMLFEDYGTYRDFIDRFETRDEAEAEALRLDDPIIMHEDEEDDYTVSIITDYEWTETCRPLAIGVTKAIAKSISRHYTPMCSSNQTVMIISRVYCLNHEDFEKNTENKFE